MLAGPEGSGGLKDQEPLNDQARSPEPSVQGVWLSGCLLVPPAFPSCGTELTFREFGLSAAAAVGTAVITAPAVEQEVNAVEEKHLYVLPFPVEDNSVQVESSLCGGCFRASTVSNGHVSEI